MLYCTYNLLNCFRHLYAHHQELETIFVLLLHMVCNALVADEGGCSSSLPHPGRITCCSVPNSQPLATKALHTMCVNNTSIVSSSWWWAYKCLKHVEQIISAIKHSVASSWFSSLCFCYCFRLPVHIKEWILPFSYNAHFCSILRLFMFVMYLFTSLLTDSVPPFLCSYVLLFREVYDFLIFS